MTVAPEKEAGFRARLHEYTRTLDCVHCGLCIPYCPTYGVSGRESDSPRGRIYLMRGYAEGTIDLSRDADRRLDQCIVCRGCETVCPSGIRMGEMMESFRDARRREKSRSPLGLVRNIVGRAVLMGVLPHRTVLSALSDLLYFYDRSGLRKVARAVARRVWPRLAALDALLPPLLPPSARRVDQEAASNGGVFPAQGGKPRARVGLFLGCIASEWCAPVHRATIRVLTRNGCEVVVPPDQTCCGALHRHGGYLDDAARLYERNAAAFGALKLDAVVVNAAGCGAALKEPPHGSAGLGAPVRDVCEFLHEIGVEPPAGSIEKKVAHHQPCHLVHAQRVPPAAVEDLLRRIPGLNLVPLPDADRCCGAGGIYNLLHPKMAEPLRDEKTAAVLSTGADIVATGNPGCWLQIRSGLAGRGIEVLHPVEILDRAYGAQAPAHAGPA
jgi:glycolate dehydrogenase iron-sulfur subunit